MDEYEERNEEMKRLRYEEGWKISEIGKRFGVSRERVRQIIGNTGRNFLRNWTEQKIETGEFKQMAEETRWDEIDSLPGVTKVWEERWKNFFHPTSNKYIERSKRFMKEASRLMLEFGIKNEIVPRSRSYDIETENGVKVGVRVSEYDRQKTPSQYKGGTSHRYLVRNLARIDCDFFFVFIPDENEEIGFTYFVIPIKESKSVLDRNSAIYLPWPPSPNKGSRLHKYHKRLDLLL